MAHHEDEGFAGAKGVEQNDEGKGGDRQTHNTVKSLGPLSIYDGADHRGEER